MKFKLIGLAVTALVLASCGKKEGDSAAPVVAAEEEKVLNVYNWSDYIAPDTLAKFEKETGIKVTYDVFDSNEVLETKLVTGNTGYDVVVPSLTFLSRQIQAGVFMPLDKSKLTNLGNLDPEIQKSIAALDKDNTHSVNYLWGTTGIGYNVKKIKEVFGDDVVVDSWDFVFNPDNLAKLKQCGVYFLDTPSEIIPPVLKYLGEEPNSFDPAVIQKAADRLVLLRPSITQFHSSEYINALANGDACIAVGWSGDIFQAAARAEEANKGVEIAYVIPKEGAPMWFDMMAIPKDAKHPNNAHLFINFIMRPDIAAEISNYVAYASANKASLAQVDAELKANPGVYPTDEAKKGLFSLAVLPADVDRSFNRIWTGLKTGQ
ncbi:MAG TPA: polyamine ABC transporter substrate-binding protein [Arenimonas sp.]|nr:polyamine ABC transporter substrate-binding protein [Arenimonas sp.]